MKFNDVFRVVKEMMRDKESYSYIRTYLWDLKRSKDITLDELKEIDFFLIKSGYADGGLTTIS